MTKTTNYFYDKQEVGTKPENIRQRKLFNSSFSKEKIKTSFENIKKLCLLYIEWINNKVLLYSTRNYIQYPVIKHNGKEYEEEGMYMYS